MPWLVHRETRIASTEARSRSSNFGAKLCKGLIKCQGECCGLMLDTESSTESTRREFGGCIMGCRAGVRSCHQDWTLERMYLSILQRNVSCTYGEFLHYSSSTAFHPRIDSPTANTFGRRRQNWVTTVGTFSPRGHDDVDAVLESVAVRLQSTRLKPGE